MKPSGTVAPLDPALPGVLRRLARLVQPVRNTIPTAEAVADLLERDLLPRTAGGDTYLVCGIVGPNNAGKSALFNALVGREVSPSVPAGGATRRLVGAASPALLEHVQSEPTLARFPLRSGGASQGPLTDALEPPSRPAELLLVAAPELPPRLMLIDTPDFDSIVVENRLASESLLAVADVLIAIVTRHSYQNRAVVEFLQYWFDHERPWMLVYNEAIDESVARSHSAKLIAQLAQRPLAVFWAPHSLDVQAGRARLLPRRLALQGRGLGDDLGQTMVQEGEADLRSLLFDLERIAELKARSFAAALARLAARIDVLTAELEAESSAARDVVRIVEERARHEGERIAAAAMPAGPFVDAFRTVLDRRTNPLSRGWRMALRGIRVQIERVVAAVKGSRPASGRTPEATNVGDIEVHALRAGWHTFWEGLVRNLGSEGRDPARRHCGADLAACLDRDLDEGRRSSALEEAAGVLELGGGEIDAFRRACEELVEQAINERGFDLDIQALADIATLAPLAIAAAVAVKTGGLGVDLAVAGGGAVSSVLMDKYSHVLGGGVLGAARRRWATLRGKRIAEVLMTVCLPDSMRVIHSVLERNGFLLEMLSAARRELSSAAAPGQGPSLHAPSTTRT